MVLHAGRADKLGNYYEQLWTVFCITEILRNKYFSINIEPLTSEAEGFEFYLRSKDVQEYHQVKRQTSKGNWTLSTLNSEGVLQNFWNKLSSNDTTICVFTSMISASNLSGLIERAARLTHSWEEFHSEVLTIKKWKKEFDQLSSYWNSPEPEVVYNNLKRIRVETFTEQRLIETVEDQLRTLTTGKDISSIRQSLQDFIVNQLGKELKAFEFR